MSFWVAMSGKKTSTIYRKTTRNYSHTTADNIHMRDIKTNNHWQFPFEVKFLHFIQAVVYKRNFRQVQHHMGSDLKYSHLTYLQINPNQITQVGTIWLTEYVYCVVCTAFWIQSTRTLFYLPNKCYSHCYEASSWMAFDFYFPFWSQLNDFLILLNSFSIKWIEWINIISNKTK